MKKVEVMFFAFGKKYEYDKDKLNFQRGIISKKVETINFVDIKDIALSINIFGWGTLSITDINGTDTMKYIKNPKETYDDINNIFIECKKSMKRVDFS